MYTIKIVAPNGVLLGYYGAFDSLDTARRVADNVTRLAQRDCNRYTTVPTPEGVRPVPLHSMYLA